MSEENVEVVRRVTEIGEEALRRDDPGAGFDNCVAEGLIATNLEYQAGTRGGIGVAGIEDVVGREGVVRFVRRWTEDFDDYETEYERFIDAGDDRVLVLAHQTEPAGKVECPLRSESPCSTNWKPGASSA